MPFIGECISHDDCPLGYCASSTATCEAPGLGKPCKLYPEDACLSRGLFCHSYTGRCARPGTTLLVPPKDCRGDFDCILDEYCSRTLKRCTLRKLEGEVCSPNSSNCKDGLSCVVGRCVKRCRGFFDCVGANQECLPIDGSPFWGCQTPNAPPPLRNRNNSRPVLVTPPPPAIVKVNDPTPPRRHHIRTSSFHHSYPRNISIYVLIAAGVVVLSLLSIVMIRMRRRRKARKLDNPSAMTPSEIAYSHPYLPPASIPEPPSYEAAVLDAPNPYYTYTPSTPTNNPETTATSSPYSSPHLPDHPDVKE